MIWKKLVSLVLLVSTIGALFYLMWVASRGYPFELSSSTLKLSDGLHSLA
jgi:hypothetical protein